MSKTMKIRGVVAGIALVALSFSAMAQTTITWTGAGDGSNYVDGVNWGGSAPTDDLTTDIAQLNGGTIDLSSTRQVAGLDYNTYSTLQGTGSIEIGTGGIYVNRNSYLNTAGLVLNQANTTITLAGGRLSLGTANTVSGTGALTVTGGNTLYIDNTGSANTYAGGTTVTGGATVSIKRGDHLGSGAIIFDNGTVSRNGTSFTLGNDIVVNSGGGTVNTDGYIDGNISGTGALTIIGLGNEKGISAGNTHSGGITLDNTFFRTKGSDSYGTGTITMKNGAIIKNNSNDLTFDNNMVLGENGGQFEIGWSKSITVNGVISGDGSLTIRPDSGTLNLNSDNTYTGETIIQGNVSGNDGSFGDNATAGAVTFDGGSLVANHHLNFGTRAITLDAGGGTVRVYNSRALTFDGVVDGTGKLTVDNDGGSVRLTNSDNSYSGGTEIIGMVNANTGGLGTGDITLNDGNGSRGQLQNFNGASTFDNNVIVAANGGRLKAGWTSDLTINGVVSGSGALTIEGDSGTVILGNTANTYSGAISLAAATSRLSLESLGADATISGDAAAILTFTGAIALDAASDFAGLTTVGADGAIGGDGSLAGDLTLSAGAGFVFSETDILTVLGTLTLDNSFSIDDLIGLDGTVAENTYTLIDTAGDFSHIQNFGAGNAVDIGGGKSAYFKNGSLQVVVIPEPATLGMVVAFGGAMLFIRRRLLI